jgi:hypothetical protein
MDDRYPPSPTHLELWQIRRDLLKNQELLAHNQLLIIDSLHLVFTAVNPAGRSTAGSEFLERAHQLIKENLDTIQHGNE